MTQRITRKFLEAQVLRCAKALGMGVVGIDSERCREFGVCPARLVRKGEPHPRRPSHKVKATGYYAEPHPDGSKGDTMVHLRIDAGSPGDGWTRYNLVVLVEHDSGHHSDYPASPWGSAMTAQEFSCYLRGVEHGALAAKELGS